MQVEQAIFTSARSSHASGYHLTARSAGIDDVLAQTISLWGPSHAALVSGEFDASSLNFFPVGHDRFALSRSVYGGPEYSARGGFQIVTSIILFHREQLAGYSDNPVALAQTVLALGHLRLQSVVDERLPALDLPDRSMLGLASPSAEDQDEENLISRVLTNLENDGRVAVFGLPNPMPTLERLFQHTPRDQRPQLSFATGLKPSVHRNFRLHFFFTTDEDLSIQLTSQGIFYLTA